jgi:hypothetical protein
MTRCDEFYEKVRKDGNFCGLQRGSFNEIKQYMAFVEKNSVLCELSAGACKHLMREKNLKIREDAINRISLRIKHGKIVTGSKIERLLESIHNGVKSKSRLYNPNILIYPMHDGEVKHHFTPRLIVGIPERIHKDCLSGNNIEVHRRKVLSWVFLNDKRKYHVMDEYLSGRMPIPNNAPFSIRKNKGGEKK